MFGFSVMQPTFCFCNVEILTVPKLALYTTLDIRLLIRDLNPTLNENVSSEKLYLYKFACFYMQMFSSIVFQLLISYLS